MHFPLIINFFLRLELFLLIILRIWTIHYIADLLTFQIVTFLGAYLHLFYLHWTQRTVFIAPDIPFIYFRYLFLDLLFLFLFLFPLPIDFYNGILLGILNVNGNWFLFPIFFSFGFVRLKLRADIFRFLFKFPFLFDLIDIFIFSRKYILAVHKLLLPPRQKNVIETFLFA